MCLCVCVCMCVCVCVHCTYVDISTYIYAVHGHYRMRDIFRCFSVAYLVTRLSEPRVSQDEGKQCLGISTRECVYPDGVLYPGMTLTLPPSSGVADEVVLPPLPF